MQASDVFWQIANFFAPAVVAGYVAAAMAKLLWRQALAGAAWFRLGTWASAAMAAVSALGLVAFEHDGKMATYAAMVVACALVLWWRGFRGGH